MKQQMYQIFSAPRHSFGTEADGHKTELLAIMPLSIIQAVFSLHKDAAHRIILETGQNEGRGICQLHFGRKPIPGFGHSVVIGRCEQWSAGQ